MKCPNCNTALSCGCQKRVASNGVQVCSNCIASYEVIIHKPTSNISPIITEDVPRERQETAPIINNVSVKLGI